MFEDAVLWQCMLLQQQCVLAMQQMMAQIQIEHARHFADVQRQQIANDTHNFLISQAHAQGLAE